MYQCCKQCESQKNIYPLALLSKLSHLERKIALVESCLRDQITASFPVCFKILFCFKRTSVSLWSVIKKSSVWEKGINMNLPGSCSSSFPRRSISFSKYSLLTTTCVLSIHERLMLIVVGDDRIVSLALLMAQPACCLIATLSTSSATLSFSDSTWPTLSDLLFERRRIA